MVTLGRPPKFPPPGLEGLMPEETLDALMDDADTLLLLFCLLKGEKDDRFLFRFWNKSFRFLGLAWLLGCSGSDLGTNSSFGFKLGDNFGAGTILMPCDFDGLTILIRSEEVCVGSIFGKKTALESVLKLFLGLKITTVSSIVVVKSTKPI